MPSWFLNLILGPSCKRGPFKFVLIWGSCSSRSDYGETVPKGWSHTINTSETLRNTWNGPAFWIPSMHLDIVQHNQILHMQHCEKANFRWLIHYNLQCTRWLIGFKGRAANFCLQKSMPIGRWLYLLSRASEAGSLKNCLGSRPRRDMGR